MNETVVVENRAGLSRFLILCDHASNHFPPEYGFLGLSPAERETHIAWDPGALGVARHLSDRLNAPLVYSTISRLVIDCNRALDAPDLIATISETTRIPGIANLTANERQRRIDTIHATFHSAVDSVLDARTAEGRATAVIGMHTFTPIYRGVSRPWDVSLIFDRDQRLSGPLIDLLKGEGLSVGVNEPYSPADRVFYTLGRHAEARGLAPAMIEIRNDLVRTPRDQQEWAERLGRMLGTLTLSSRAA